MEWIIIIGCSKGSETDCHERDEEVDINGRMREWIIIGRLKCGKLL